VLLFDKIEKAHPKIMDKFLQTIRGELYKKRGLSIEFAAPVYVYLQEKAAGNIEQGGRGIGNLVETALVNPLARLVFDNQLRNQGLLINQVNEKELAGQIVYELDISTSSK